MLLIMGGVCVTGIFHQLDVVAPDFNPHPKGAPPMVPFLFITIACGAISGFHSLVSSGTSSKQLAHADEALFVGYGSMLLEAALATLIMITVAAGIGLAYKTADGATLTGFAAWNAHYSSWEGSQGMGAKIGAVVIGAANMMRNIGIPERIGVAIIGVFIASFAGTTLDTATRIQRYTFTEFFLDLKFGLTGGKEHALSGLLEILSHRVPATLLAVVTAGALAFATGANGSGALTLWPMFGAVNQLLAALGLLVLSNYLRQKGGWKFLVTAIPAVFMLVITIWSVYLNEINFLLGRQWVLIVINGLILVLALWMTAECCWKGVKRYGNGNHQGE